MRTRRKAVAIGFMTIWLTVWTGMLLAMLWTLAGRLFEGEPSAVVVILVWLAGGALGVWKGAERLWALVVDGQARRRRPARPRAWDDGMADRERR